jgi:predicted phage terminase large subunit-like protein
MELLKLDIDSKMANKGEYRLKSGGGILTVGTSGSITGQGANILIIDDPISNREEADSIVYRNKLWDWFTDVAETRLEPNGSIIIVMTRWHIDDLAGRILKNKPDFEYIRLAALADNGDGRELDEPLWADRYGFEHLNQIRVESPLKFSALYQGLPVPRNSRLIQDVTFYTELPKEYKLFIGADLAYTEKTHADYSCYVVLGYTKEPKKWYVIEVDRWQKSIDYSVNRLKLLQSKYPHTKIELEANGVQKAICDIVEKAGVKISRVQPVTDKLARAGQFADSWTQGNVLCPDPQVYPDNKWLNYYLEELNEFSGLNDRHDDLVDASTHAYNKSLKGVGTFRAF